MSEPKLNTLNTLKSGDRPPNEIDKDKLNEVAKDAKAFPIRKIKKGEKP